MTRYYLFRPGKSVLPLVSVRESLQFREKIKELKPTGKSLISRGVISLGHEIVGKITLRLNRETLPALMFMITEQITDSDHLEQTQGLFYHDLETSPLESSNLSLIQETNESLSLMENLILNEFQLAGRRREAVLLTLRLTGVQPRIFSFGKDGAPEVPDQGFLKLEGNEISSGEYTIPGLAAFSLIGTFNANQKLQKLMIRRKDQVTTDYSFMRQRLSFRINLASRDRYEIGQPVRGEITIDEALYQGEESFPDNKGIWGREFHYTIIGPVKIRVFTHLDTEGRSL